MFPFLIALLLVPGPPCPPPAMPVDDGRGDEVSKLLHDAQDDARHERNAEALQKLQRYFVASRDVPGQGGVRLSFALSTWKELADAYPPAGDALRAGRDEALGTFRKGGCEAFKAYHEFVSINEALDEEARTVQEFLRLHASDRTLAARVYRLSEAALLAAREFRVAGAYVDPMDDWDQILRSRDLHRRYRSQRPREGMDSRLEAYEEKSFAHRSTTLIALLVVNDRREEAEEIARRAKGEWDDKLFHAAVDRALEGQVPPPWP
jgi:hypothetical protein